MTDEQSDPPAPPPPPAETKVLPRDSDFGSKRAEVFPTVEVKPADKAPTSMPEALLGVPEPAQIVDAPPPSSPPPTAQGDTGTSTNE